MCRRATKPVHQNFWTCVPRARAPQQEKRPQWEAWTRPRGVAPVSPQPEKARTQPPRPAATKNKYIKKKRTEDTLWFWGKIIHEGACEVWGLLEKHMEWYRNPGRRTDVVTPVGCRRREELGYRNWEGTRFTSPRLLLSLLGSQRAGSLRVSIRLPTWRYLSHTPGGLVLSKLCERRGVIAMLPRKRDKIRSVPCPSYH